MKMYTEEDICNEHSHQSALAYYITVYKITAYIDALYDHKVEETDPSPSDESIKQMRNQYRSALTNLKDICSPQEPWLNGCFSEIFLMIFNTFIDLYGVDILGMDKELYEDLKFLASYASQYPDLLIEEIYKTVNDLNTDNDE